MIGDKGILPSLLAMYLSKEDSKSIALILSQFDPLLSAGILDRLPEEMLGDVIFHMASGQFNESLSEEIRAILLDEILDDAGGPKVAADILNRTDTSTEVKMMTYLDAQDPAALEGALGEIAASVVGCQFSLGEIDEMEVGLDEVNFYFDGNVVGYDENCAAGKGWSWYSTAALEVRNIKVVEFCTAACDRLNSGEVAEITAAVGCARQPVR